MGKQKYSGLKMQYPVESPLVIIVGPTAVGKTDLSIRLAEEINAEIISADSRYLYRRMDIGTAKPNKYEMAEIKHHLIDVAAIENPWSLAVFKEKAFKIIKDIHSRGKIPLLVGGTGQYIRAIIEGWNVPELLPNEQLRKILFNFANEIGEQGVHRWLSILDLKAAESIDYRNLRRTVRALEVILSTGIRFSMLKNRSPIDFQYKIIGLYRSREELFQRIDFRIEEMIRKGFIDEVRGLINSGYSLSNAPMSAIGYPEITQYLHGDVGLLQALKDIKKRTRIFVRRQANWFKLNDKRIRWFEMKDNSLMRFISFLEEKKEWICE